MNHVSKEPHAQAFTLIHIELVDRVPRIKCAPTGTAVHSSNSLPVLSSNAAIRLSPVGRPVVASGGLSSRAAMWLSHLGRSVVASGGPSGHAAMWLSPLGRSVIASGFSHSARASLVFRPLGPTITPAETPPRLDTPGVGPRGQESKEHAFEWLKPLATTERPKGEGEPCKEAFGSRRCPKGTRTSTTSRSWPKEPHSSAKR